MLKYLLIGLLLLTGTFSLSGQSIKHKKGVILVDKKPAYHFTKLAGNLFKNEDFSYAMTSLNGDTLIKYHTVHRNLVQLPHEKQARSGVSYYTVDYRSLGKTGKVSLVGPNFGNTFTSAVRSTGFLTASGFDESKLGNLEDKLGLEALERKLIAVDSTNYYRKTNATKTVKLNGPMIKRGAATIKLDGKDIKCSAVKLGTIDVAKTNSFGTTYEVIAMETRVKTGKRVATIYQVKNKGKVHLKTMIDNKGINLKITGIVFTPEEQLKIIKYLVDYGYL